MRQLAAADAARWQPQAALGLETCAAAAIGGLFSDRWSLQTTGPHCGVGRLLWWPVVLLLCCSDLLAPSHQTATAAAAGSRFLLLATCWAAARLLGSATYATVACCCVVCAQAHSFSSVGAAAALLSRPPFGPERALLAAGADSVCQYGGRGFGGSHWGYLNCSLYLLGPPAV